jgi:hypothetical protein
MHVDRILSRGNFGSIPPPSTRPTDIDTAGKADAAARLTAPR